jgi:hypothetical protein
VLEKGQSMSNEAQQTNGTSSRSSSQDIPILLQFWINLQSSLPCMPIFGMNFSLTLLSSICLGIVRYVAEFILVHAFGWPSHSFDTKMAASSCGSIVHSLNLVPALGLLFASHRYNPSESLVDAPVWWRQAVTALLQFCTGYMIYDAVLNICWCKLSMGRGPLDSEDYMFLGHHLATVLYMISTRITGAGHQSAMICMFLGEMTNPVHNSYYVAIAAQQMTCCNGTFSKAMFVGIEFCFGLSYFIMRALVAPVIFMHLTFVLWWRRNKRLPMWLIALWSLLIWGVEIGSIPWIKDCWAMVEKRLPEKALFVLHRFIGKMGDEL